MRNLFSAGQVFLVFALATGFWSTGLWTHAVPRANGAAVPAGHPCCNTAVNIRNCEGCQPIVPADPSEGYVLIRHENPTFGCDRSRRARPGSECSDANRTCTETTRIYDKFTDAACTMGRDPGYRVLLLRPQCARDMGDHDCP